MNIFQLPEPEDVKEIPGDRGHPAGVEGLQLDAALQHRLEPQGEGEGHLGAHWSVVTAARDTSDQTEELYNRDTTAGDTAAKDTTAGDTRDG